MLSQRSLWLSSFFFVVVVVLFSVFCFVAVRATILSSRPISSSSACYSAIDSFHCIVHSVCSLVILGLWWTFLISSFFFPRSWIVFTIIILNSFSGRCLFPPLLVVFLRFYPVPSSGTHLAAFSLWLTFCYVVFLLVVAGLEFSLLLLSAPWWIRLRGLCKLPDGKDWWWEKLDLALVGRVVLSKTNLGTSLLVQWLTLRLPMHRVQVWSLVVELRSHMPYGQETRS